MTELSKWLSANEGFRSAIDLHGTDVTVRSNAHTGLDGFPIEIIVDGGTSKETNEDDAVLVNDLQKENKVNSDSSDEPQQDKTKATADSEVASSESFRQTPNTKDAVMKNLSQYMASMEDHVDVQPVAEVVEIDPVEQLPGEPVEIIAPELYPAPLEQTVELPEQMDPTPMEPLEDDLVAEEIVSDAVDAEAQNLMGAQITLENYQRLLRSAGTNMSAQSAAFMRVGMELFTPAKSVGLEDYGVDGNRSVMSRVAISQEDFKSTAKEIATKAIEWLKKKWAAIKAQWAKLKQYLFGEKEKVTYLLGASQAMQAKRLPAPATEQATQSLKTAKMASEEKEFAPVDVGNIDVSGAALGLFKNGKLDTRMEGLVNFISNDLPKELKAAETAVEDMTSLYAKIANAKSQDDVSNMIDEFNKKHAPGGSVEVEVIPGVVFSREENGKVSFQNVETDGGSQSVKAPSLEEISAIMKTMQESVGQIKAVSDTLDKIIDVTNGPAYGSKLQELFEKMSDEQRGWASALATRVTCGVNTVGPLIVLEKAVLGFRRDVVVFCDSVLAKYAGAKDTISAEDYMALPGPSSPGLMARAQDALRKFLEWLRKMWAQAKAKAKLLFDRMFGTRRKTEVLLLTNNVIPEQAGGVVGTAAEGGLAGSRAKSAGLARQLLLGHDAVPVQAEVAAPTTNVPAGHVAVADAGKLMFRGSITIQPEWEKSMVDWLVNKYPKALSIAYARISGWARNVDDWTGWRNEFRGILGDLYAGAPLDELPGGYQVARSELGGVSLQYVAAEGEHFVKVVNKRSIDQALSAQKQHLNYMTTKLNLADADKVRESLFTILDKRSATARNDQVRGDILVVAQAITREITNPGADAFVKIITDMADVRNALCDEMIAARVKK